MTSVIERRLEELVEAINEGLMLVAGPETAKLVNDALYRCGYVERCASVYFLEEGEVQAIKIHGGYRICPQEPREPL